MKPPAPSLEQDLKNSGEISVKCQKKSYAQNLYAALCNNCWQSQEIWSILQDQVWSCGWRTAGGIIAEIRNCGETYLDWYCSGIPIDADFEFYRDQVNCDLNNTVREGTVTDEIRQDLLQLGWRCVEQGDTGE